MLIRQSVCNCLLILAAGVEFDNFASIAVLHIRCQQAKYVVVNVVLAFAMGFLDRADFAADCISLK